MIIKGKELTAEQERKYREIMAQMDAEAEQIPPWPLRSGGAVFNNHVANAPYKLLTKKYMPLIYAIVEDAPSDSPKEGSGASG